MKADNTYRSAWEASPLAIITLDERGCVRSCNPSSEQLFQRHSDQLIGQLLRSMAHALDRGAVQQMISEALAGRKPARQEIRFLRPGQQIVVTGFNAAPVGPDDDGAVCIIRDINHEKALRPQLLHTERMASIGKVASVVAHELNNALAGALGCLQLVPRSPDPAIQELWDSMASELRRSADIVRELKGYARAEEGMSDQIELPKLFGRLETLRRYQRSTHPSPLEVTIEPGVPGLVGNGNQLLQALLNLVGNAEHAVADLPDERRVIRVSARASTGVVLIEVTDHGPGIPESLRARLFEPFYSTKPAGEGTGLGLTVVQAVAAGHGGRIEIDETPGGGATFRLVLPRASGATPSAKPPGDPSPGPRPALRGARVLIADDEPVLRRVIERACNEAGLRSTCVSSSESACEALGQHDFDLVVLDVRMPQGGGAQVFRRIHADHPRLVPRTVFMSGELAEDMSEIVGQGYAGILYKPFDLGDLLDMLDEAMTGSSDRSA